MTTVVGTTDLPLPVIRRGKVRDVYVVDDARLLLVATDRVSAFDVVMNELVPFKGSVLNQITAWWLRQFEKDVPNHMITTDPGEIVTAVPALAPHRDVLEGRSMLVRRTEVIMVECVIRGYLSGSAWKEYKASGTLAGEPLAKGLVESDRFDPPIFSPSTKADVGHDENITVDQVRRTVGDATAAELERFTRLVYGRGRDIAAARGIIIADTKFEFGRLPDGKIILIDEVLTPDSSRFWPADKYKPGGGQPSFDKQPLRDYLEGERKAGRWNGNAPPPTLPPEVVDATSRRYREAFKLLTGTTLSVAGA
jgi:phosphoribosylaminoimidazole-succinocarboxamide synthase